MSSALRHRSHERLWVAISGYLLFAGSLAMILVVLAEGWLW